VPTLRKEREKTQNYKDDARGKELRMGGITSLSVVNVTANASSDVTQKQEQQQTQRQQPATRGSDTEELTEAQQVYQLHNQRYQVTQIASSLSVAAVNSYLNISSSGA
jgi:hypothetical protein